MTITDRRSGSASASTASSRLGGIPEGLCCKAPVVAATTANITLSGEQTIDGVAVVEGNRVLVKDQTTASQNGIYDVSTGNWSRSVDAATNGDLVKGTKVFVFGGTLYGTTEWFVSSNDDNIVIGTDSIAFSKGASVPLSSSVDEVIIRADGTLGNLQTSIVKIDDSGNIAPVTTNTGALGTTALQWADLFLATGGVINWANGGATITYNAAAADELSFAGATGGYLFDAAVAPSSDDGAALGNATNKRWSDAFFASGAVLNFNNGNYTLTHSAGNLTAAGGPFTAPSFIPSGSTLPTNGLYLPASNTLGWAINSAAELQLTASAFSPAVSDGNALGTASLMWGDLFLASGGVINFNAGDVTITHAVDALLFAGATATNPYSFDNTVLVGTAANGLQYGSASITRTATNGSIAIAAGTASGVIQWTASTTGQISLSGTSLVTTVPITPNINDNAALGTTALSWSDLFLAAGGVLNWANGTVTIHENSDALHFSSASAGYRFDNAVLPNTDDVAALGSTSLKWSDLFLASGAVINFNSGDITITHSVGGGGGLLQFAGASDGYLFSTTIGPTANDGGALGSTSVQWSDLFLASGAVVNFDSGDVTITHSANSLAFAGASSGYSFDATVGVTGAIFYNGASAFLDMAEISSPASPSADRLRLFAKDVGGATHLFQRDSAGTEVDITNAAGGAVVAATQAEMEAASSTSVFSSPGRAQYHPGVAKVVAPFTVSGGTPTLDSASAYNVSSLTDTAVGRVTVNFTTAFTAGDYAVLATGEYDAGTQVTIGGRYTDTARGTSSVEVGFFKQDTNLADTREGHIVCYGNQ